MELRAFVTAVLGAVSEREHIYLHVGVSVGINLIVIPLGSSQCVCDTALCFENKYQVFYYFRFEAQKLQYITVCVVLVCINTAFDLRLALPSMLENTCRCCFAPIAMRNTHTSVPIKYDNSPESKTPMPIQSL